MDVGAVNSLSTGKGKGSSSPRDGYFKYGEHIFNNCNARKVTACNHLAKTDRASHGPRVMAKDRVRKVRGKTKGTSKLSKGVKGSYKRKTSNTGLIGLENPKTETISETQESAQSYPTDNSYTDNSWCDGGWSNDEWNDDDWSSVGWHEGLGS